MSKQEVFICECSSREHQIIMEYEPEDNEVYVTIHLSQPTLWKRFKYALKYIFGYKCRYGAFEEVILSEKHIPALNRIMFKLKNHDSKSGTQKSI